MFSRLPPAGERIPAPNRDPAGNDYRSIFSPYAATFYGSGTQALAAALIAAIRRKNVSDPEVLLPAYTCPALISAALYARAKPVLVDFTPDRPWMDLKQVATKITERTVAIVAVDLFGIPERLSALRDGATSCGAMLIEDSAQRLPEPGTPSSPADFVILSFGRGKPVTVLGGGAVLTTDPRSDKQLPPPEPTRTPSAIERIRVPMEAALYNFLLPPSRYWMAASAPFLHLGETRYKRLPGIHPMTEQKLARLGPALRDYWQRRDCVHDSLRRMLSRLGDSSVLDLAAACDVKHASQLGRYPLLFATPELRAAALHDLAAAGLGASAMYPAPLLHIPGLENVLARQGGFPGAETFSERILTLPTHTAVRQHHVDRMYQILMRTLR